eukprot:211077_1
MEALKKYSPQYTHLNDTLAFVVHLSFLTENCKLIGLHEEQYLDDLGSIPQGWNKSDEIYQFRYILKADKKEEQKEDKQKKNTILVKILSMDKNQLLITAIKQGSNDVYTLEININDHIDVAKASKTLNDYPSYYKDIDGLLLLLNDQITNKVLPHKKKPQKEEKKDKQKAQNDPDPLIFPDPNPGRNPLLIGGGRPGIGGVPFGRGDMDPFGGGGGGNLMGPNQINQQWRNRNDPNDPNGNRPNPLVPPGARFDPFGPGRNFPGGPDPDHFKPPGGGFGGGFGGFGGIM